MELEDRMPSSTGGVTLSGVMTRLALRLRGSSRSVRNVVATPGLEKLSNSVTSQ